MHGSDSYDPNGGFSSLSYSWTQIAGPQVILSDANSARATFVAPKVVDRPNVVFSLVVSDGQSTSNPSATATIVIVPSKVDVTPPVFQNVPNTPIVLEAPNDSGTTVTYSITAIDDTDGPITLSCNPASGSFFQKGEARVICTAKDKANNIAYTSFQVSVKSPPFPPPGHYCHWPFCGHGVRNCSKMAQEEKEGFNTG